MCSGSQGAPARLLHVGPRSSPASSLGSPLLPPRGPPFSSPQMLRVHSPPHAFVPTFLPGIAIFSYAITSIVLLLKCSLFSMVLSARSIENWTIIFYHNISLFTSLRLATHVIPVTSTRMYVPQERHIIFLTPHCSLMV